MKAFAVIGSWRGGTSLVTSVLNALGVFVGGEFFEARNGYCTFEDIQLRKACLTCFDERPGHWRYYGSHESRVKFLREWILWARNRALESGHVACGGKHPIMCKLINELQEAWVVEGCVTPTLVSVLRAPQEIHRSWTRPRGQGQPHWWPRCDREYVVNDLLMSRDIALATRPHVVVDFEALRRKPKKEIERLATACQLPTVNISNAVRRVR